MALATSHPAPLSELDVLVIDGQATAAAPGGHLLEIGWTRTGASAGPIRTRLIRSSGRERIPPAVMRLTGLSERLLSGGVDPSAAWRELSNEAATFAQQPAPTVIHFARFERPFLRALAGDALPLDIVCTHEIATRVLPDLPRRSLRALAGYFGRAVGQLRRSANHVEATAFVWRELIALLDAQGVSTWDALREWLSTPIDRTKRARRSWPMPRDLRLSLPDAPGVYRLLRTGGDVLYVGKAVSIRHRVNSYFRKQAGVPERLLEMLSQARGISFEVVPTALEAALIEPDEIKRLRPPYNLALTAYDRVVWFAAPDFTQRRPRPSRRCTLGPFPSAELLDQFAALAQASPDAFPPGRWSPHESVFEAGYARLMAAHPELSGGDVSPHARLLRLGTRLWREGRRDRDDDEEEGRTNRSATPWTAERVQIALEWLALRAALACRRARWFTRLVDATVAWSEPGTSERRLVIIGNGEILDHARVEAGLTPPAPPGGKRPVGDRREAFTVARFDRLRVLTTELKRLVSAGSPVTIRLGNGLVLTGERLARTLAWL